MVKDEKDKRHVLKFQINLHVSLELRITRLIQSSYNFQMEYIYLKVVYFALNSFLQRVMESTKITIWMEILKTKWKR